MLQGHHEGKGIRPQNWSKLEADEDLWFGDGDGQDFGKPRKTQRELHEERKARQSALQGASVGGR